MISLTIPFSNLEVVSLQLKLLTMSCICTSCLSWIGVNKIALIESFEKSMLLRVKIDMLLSFTKAC